MINPLAKIVLLPWKGERRCVVWQRQECQARSEKVKCKGRQLQKEVKITSADITILPEKVQSSGLGSITFQQIAYLYQP